MQYHRASSLGTLRLYTLFLLSILLVITVLSNTFGEIDYCARERIYNRSWTRHSHLFISFACILANAALLTIWKPFKPLNVKDKKYLKSLFYIGYTILWYGATYCVCYIGKKWLADSLCNKEKHNSVSGHFLFHTFFLMAFPYWFFTIGRSSYKDSVRPTPNNRKNNRNELQMVKKLLTSSNLVIYIVLVYIVYIYASYINLESTWANGFHTIRQILYGVILSLTSFYLLLTITGYVGLKTERQFTMLLIILAVFWISAVSLVFIFGYRFPFGKIEMLLGSLLFCLLFYVSRFATIPPNSKLAPKYKNSAQKPSKNIKQD